MLSAAGVLLSFWCLILGPSKIIVPKASSMSGTESRWTTSHRRWCGVSQFGQHAPCGQDQGLCPVHKLLPRHQRDRKRLVILVIFYKKNTSSAKGSPAVACSSSLPLHAISLIFRARLYKFRRQFRWYVASLCNRAFSCVRRSMSSRINASKQTRKSSWNVAASWRLWFKQEWKLTFSIHPNLWRFWWYKSVFPILEVKHVTISSRLTKNDNLKQLINICLFYKYFHWLISSLWHLDFN